MLTTGRLKTAAAAALTAVVIAACTAEKDPFTGRYYNSSMRNILESIEISEDFNVKLYYSDRTEEYQGEKRGGELVLNLENGGGLHMYKNGAELRVYKKSPGAYQPEDVDLTFYGKDLIDRLRGSE